MEGLGEFKKSSPVPGKKNVAFKEDLVKTP